MNMAVRYTHHVPGGMGCKGKGCEAARVWAAGVMVNGLMGEVSYNIPSG